MVAQSTSERSACAPTPRLDYTKSLRASAACCFDASLRQRVLYVFAQQLQQQLDGRVHNVVVRIACWLGSKCLSARVGGSTLVWWGAAARGHDLPAACQRRSSTLPSSSYRLSSSCHQIKVSRRDRGTAACLKSCTSRSVNRARKEAARESGNPIVRIASNHRPSTANRTSTRSAYSIYHLPRLLRSRDRLKQRTQLA